MVKRGLTYTVKDKGAFKKIQALEKSIIAGGKATVEELGKLGQGYAKEHVPKDTRQTFDAITYRVSPQANGNTNGSIYILERNRSESAKTTHDVARLMARGFVEKKSGDPYFMLETRNYLNRIKKQIGNKNIKQGKQPETSTGI
jgi:hypothetical protein